MLKTILKQKIINNLPQSLLHIIISMEIPKKIPNHQVYADYVKNKKGIEIGGPSPLFHKIYNQVSDLDGVNFSHNTMWEGAIQAGRHFNFIGNRKGFQFISEATDLSRINSNSYDFLLSSNCLEHVANPLKALLEWKRVIRSGRGLILVLPNKARNFDHERPFTTFEHILSDLKAGTTEHDLTHLDDILALHDLSMDPAAGSLEHFRQRSLNNFSNRTLHHHVFDMKLIKEMLDYAGFDVVAASETPFEFSALAIKRD